MTDFGECIFCEDPADENHHILPTAVRKAMGWHGKKYQYILNHKVPICDRHHKILTNLLEPLVVLIMELRKPYVSMGLVIELERVINKYGKQKEEEKNDDERKET